MELEQAVAIRKEALESKGVLSGILRAGEREPKARRSTNGDLMRLDVDVRLGQQLTFILWKLQGM